MVSESLAVLPAGLACTMRGYQRRALAWMASREAGTATGQGSSSDGASSSATAASGAAIWNGTSHPSWEKACLPSGLPFFYNWMTGRKSTLCLYVVPAMCLEQMLMPKAGWSQCFSAWEADTN